MKPYPLGILIALVFFLLSPVVPITFAQSLPGTWQIYNSSNSDLPSNYIRGVAIDIDGSKWFGSDFGGAAKFDGSNWTIYNTSNSGLPNNTVNAIEIDEDGSKWFGTDGYAAMFDGINWTIYNQFNSSIPHNQVSFITTDSTGSKWFGTWGGGAAKYDGNSWTVYNPSNSGLPSGYVADILIDSNGNKWFSTVEGIASFDGNSWTTYTTANSDLPVNHVTGATMDSDGSIWFGTNGGGIVRFDGINWQVYNNTNSGLPSNYVYKFSREIDNSKWFSTNAGAVRFSGTIWQIYNTSNSCLPSNNIGVILTDSLGYIWFGTGGGGVAVMYSKDGSSCSATAPTPTPTPTPIPVSKVVVIPGYAGSSNAEALFLCKANGYSGGWGPMPSSEKIYDPLLTSLEQNGFISLPFYYDWRRTANESALKLKQFIETHTVTGENVHIVAHSFGGLVARAYLEQEQQNSRLEKLLTVGTPHKGVINAYAAWSAGKILGNLEWRIAGSVIKKFCSDYGQADRDIIQNALPSVQNMLPIFDYLIDKRSNNLIPVLSMYTQNNWLPNTLFDPPFYGKSVGTIRGTGKNTLQKLEVKDPNSNDELLGNWLDGFPNKRYHTHYGDGLILENSAMLPGADNRFFRGDHAAIVSSENGTKTILAFLKGEPDVTENTDTQNGNTDGETAIVLASYPATFDITDSKKQKYTDIHFFTFKNPESGEYYLTIRKNNLDSTFVVGQFLPNDKVLWKDYKIMGKQNKTGTLKFDMNQPKEDILSL